MPPNERPRGEYEKRNIARCVWCGEQFESNHSNARTCSQKCRSRLAAFKARTGFDPEEPVGNITAQTALDQLLAKLLEEERRRRSFVAALQEGGTAKLFEVVKQQPPTAATKKKGA